MKAFRILAAALLSSVVLSFQAKAEWIQASSPHFIVYSEDSPEAVRSFTEKLEKFDAAVRAARKMNDPERSPSSRLVIYQVKDLAAVARLYPGSGSTVAGFYNPVVQGP